MSRCTCLPAGRNGKLVLAQAGKAYKSLFLMDLGKNSGLAAKGAMNKPYEYC